MKKFLLILTAITAVSLVGCDKTVNYKEEGSKMAKELDQLCEQQNSAVIALDDSIHAMEARLVAANDSAAIADFTEALKDSRKRNAPTIAALKVKQGMKKEEAIKSIADDVMKGTLDVAVLSDAIDAVNKVAAE